MCPETSGRLWDRGSDPGLRAHLIGQAAPPLSAAACSQSGPSIVDLDSDDERADAPPRV